MVPHFRKVWRFMVFLEVEYEKQILDDFSEHTPPKVKLIFERGEQ